MSILHSDASPEIDVAELERLMAEGDVRLLDVREPREFQRVRVPGAVNVPLGQLVAQTPNLLRDKPYAVICQSGHRSLSATEYLLGHGFEGTVSVKGGTGQWTITGRPVERG
jgi:rhodanese-related sulfurtransferase